MRLFVCWDIVYPNGDATVWICAPSFLLRHHHHYYHPHMIDLLFIYRPESNLAVEGEVRPSTQQLLFSSSKMRNGLWRDAVICQREGRTDGRTEAERQKVAEKEGERRGGEYEWLVGDSVEETEGRHGVDDGRTRTWPTPFL